jgi:hypothetical protein
VSLPPAFIGAHEDDSACEALRANDAVVANELDIATEEDIANEELNA